MNFDHRKPWVDHVCIQNWDVKRTAEWREAWGKPIVNDEPEYEGNIPRPWGNISARELVHRFWITVMRGGYAGHGETFMHPQDLLWWAKGGELRGESWKRIGFLRDLIEADVKNGLTPFTPENARWEFQRVSGARGWRCHLSLFWRTSAGRLGGRPADGGLRVRDRPDRHLEHDGRSRSTKRRCRSRQDLRQRDGADRRRQAGGGLRGRFSRQALPSGSRAPQALIARRDFNRRNRHGVEKTAPPSLRGALRRSGQGPQHGVRHARQTVMLRPWIADFAPMPGGESDLLTPPPTSP